MNLITVEDYKRELRKKWPLFKCPKKSDRIFIPEDIWQQIDWTDNEKEINAALPHKMWNMRHDDNPWPFCHAFRGEDAFGPRAASGSPKHKSTPPKLVKGRGIARWMSIGDTSILEIPLFANEAKVWTPDNIPEKLEVIERLGGHPLNGRPMEMTRADLFKQYGPSPLQKFSESSFLECDPWHISWHKMLKRREYLGNVINEDATDEVMFFRLGWRWDSFDDYYVKNAKYIGLRWN